MCGIAGYWNDKEIVTEQPIQRMLEILERRGPDAEGIYLNNNYAAGHRRLSIQDLDPRSNQPMFAQNEDYSIVFNGEIYNAQELAKQLNYRPKTTGDTEILLEGLVQMGPSFISKLNGMFAFSFYDKKKNKLLVARDRYGIKPLYYYHQNGKFIFASGVKALLATKEIPRKVNPNALLDYLRFQYVQAPNTMIENIYQVLPGYYILLDAEGIKQKQYFDITQVNRNMIPTYEGAKVQVKTKFFKSVERRLISDVKTGAFLSGGIDSSAVVAAASEIMGSGKLNTLSIGFEEEEFSEIKYAELVAAKYKTNHQNIILKSNELLDIIPDAFAQMDTPSADGMNSYLISKKTKETGISVALSGLGGDELFGGYPVFDWLPKIQKQKWMTSFPPEIRGVAAWMVKAVKRGPQGRKLAELIQEPYFDTEYLYQNNRQVFDDLLLQKIYNGKMTRNSAYSLGSEIIAYETPGFDLGVIGQISVMEASTYMAHTLLKDTDQMSMAHSLEVRVPFLDHELVQTVLAYPDEYKIGPKPKNLLLDAMGDLIPKEVWDRPKMGFVLPFEVWMRGELRQFCEESLSYLQGFEMLNYREIENLWGAFLNKKGKINWSRLWYLVALGAWLKTNNIEKA